MTPAAARANFERAARAYIARLYARRSCKREKERAIVAYCQLLTAERNASQTTPAASPPPARTRLPYKDD